MPELPNPKHELFANIVARGNSPYAAYAALGYGDNIEAANSLSNLKAVRERIDELIPLYTNIYGKYDQRYART